MTVIAVNPQVRAGTGSTPAKAAGARGAKSVPPAAAATSRRGFTPLTPMRHQAAQSMSRLAGQVAKVHPDMTAHQHVRDAARMLRAGNEEAAQRHLRAAMFAMTPQSLMRNGMHTDDDHIAARDAMHGVHRHLLLVKDIADIFSKAASLGVGIIDLLTGKLRGLHTALGGTAGGQLSTLFTTHKAEILASKRSVQVAIKRSSGTVSTALRTMEVA